MKDKSIFDGVVFFEAEGLTYQAIRTSADWNMAALDEGHILERRDIQAPVDSSPGSLLRAWWAAQKKAGTFRVPHKYSNYPTYD
jgi:hypothetical protein